MPDPGSLYIRWSETGADDNRSDPGGAPWWRSKSVRIINPADPAQDDGLAITGVDQQLRVDVDTTLVTTNVGVQVWACAWGTAGQPYLPSAGGPGGLERELDDMLNPFTANPVPPAAAQLAIDLDWRPTNADLTSIGEPLNADLKVCLQANCYSTAGAGDGLKIPPPGPPVIDVPNNRHHAQRNIRVHPVLGVRDRIKLSGFSGNPFADGEDVFVLAAAEPRRPRLDEDDLARLQAGRWLRKDEQLAGRGAELQLAREPVDELGLAVAGDKSRTGPLELPLTAGKPQRFELDVVVPESRPGTLRVIDIDHRHGKQVVGGASVLVVTVEEERFAALHAESHAAV